jgi:hypothetical protein
MKIRTEEDVSGFAPRDCRFTAYDDDVYDGAPDSRNRHYIGFGATAAEAVADLQRLLAEVAEMDDAPHAASEAWL